MKLTHYIQRLKNIFTEGYKYTKYSSFPAGHYYSPIVNLDEYRQLKKTASDVLTDIDLHESDQLEIIQSFSGMMHDTDTKDHAITNRYNGKNNWFPEADSVFLNCMIRRYSPGQIIEVGSGYSSALMLDVNDAFCKDRIKFTFIEPNPERLQQLLRKEDYQNTTIIAQNVQTVDLNLFKSLKPNDFLFIDSSHISKTASDVNFIFFNILPVLPSGVIIHFHDIFFPFEYPEDWILSGKNWNEIYLLRAFLQNNDKYKALLFVDLIQKKYPETLQKIPALKNKMFGSSFYMLKK